MVIKIAVDSKIKKFTITIRYMIFSVWLRTGSYPADINRFRSHAGKCSVTILTTTYIIYNTK